MPSTVRNPRDYYKHLTNDELIEHCVAYSESIHSMANELMKWRNREVLDRIKNVQAA